MESKIIAGAPNTSAPAQVIEKPEIIIKVENLPTDSAPAPKVAAMQGKKASELGNDPAKNTEKPAENKPAKGPKATSQPKGTPASAKAAKNKAKSGKSGRMFVMVSRHTSRIRLTRTSVALRIYSAFLQFFTVMNLSLLLLLVYLTRKSDVIAFLNSVAASLSTTLHNELSFPVAMLVIALTAQLNFFWRILCQFCRR